jgi:hypothetical protein
MILLRELGHVVGLTRRCSRRPPGPVKYRIQTKPAAERQCVRPTMES